MIQVPKVSLPYFKASYNFRGTAVLAQKENDVLTYSRSSVGSTTGVSRPAQICD